jgi:transposase
MLDIACRPVYEVGHFGFRLHDRLVAHGIPCLVTPPSLVPQEYGNRVKTDRRDSCKLAHLLSKGMLKRGWVPSEEELYHRQVIRRRRQLVRDRVRTQSRIKAELRSHGVYLEEPRGRWTQGYFDTLRRIRFGNRWMQESFNRLLEQYAFLSAQIEKQTQLLRELSETDLLPRAGGDLAEHPRYRDYFRHGTVFGAPRCASPPSAKIP